VSVAPNTREVATPADHQCQPQDSNSDREQFLHASLEKGSYGQDFMYPVYPCGRTPPIRILHFKPPTYIWSTADKAIRFAEWDFNCARPQSIHHSCARPRSTTHDHHGQHCLTRRATPAEHAQQKFSPHVHQILKALAIKPRHPAPSACCLTNHGARGAHSLRHHSHQTSRNLPRLCHLARKRFRSRPESGSAGERTRKSDIGGGRAGMTPGRLAFTG